MIKIIQGDITTLAVDAIVNAATYQDPRKNRIAAELISHAIQINHDGCISTQVLHEFCNTMQGKLHQSKELIDGYLDYYRELLMTDVTVDLVRHAFANGARAGDGVTVIPFVVHAPSL